ncbi:MAG: ABC transporter permease [Firmicutes bacterium]|nr:ABC transporter permease [Bacillota bacterium]
MSSKRKSHNPLMKRIPRELKKDLGKYIALFLFMALMIGLVSGFIVADSSMIKAYNDSFDKFAIENGHFNCDLKLTDRAIRNIEDEDVSLYQIFYKDKTAEIGGEPKTIRVYRLEDRMDGDTVKINGADVMEGRLPQKAGEIVLDRLFAVNNGISVGDTVTIESQKLEIVGLVALGDYSAMFKNNSDMMFNASAFSISLVTDDQFKAFENGGLVYSYAWRYKDQSLTDDEQRTRADDLIETVYENSMLGADTSWSPMVWNMLLSADAFDDGGDLDVIETDAPLDEFISRRDNQAIQFTGEDMGSDKIMFEWFLYIVTVVLAFAFAITTRSTIEQEAKTIGTLRASGYTREELLAHYILLPVIVTLAAALVGNVLGYTVLKYTMADMYYHSYSLPTYVTVWSGEAFLKTTLIPCALVILVELLVIGRALSLPPLAFLRRDLKRKKQSRAVRLPAFRFATRFRLRVMLQNRSTYFLLFAGIFLASVIFLFGSLFLPLLHQFKAQIQESEFCNYQYILKEPVDTETDGAEKYAVTTLENDRGEKLTVYGIDPDSAYLDTHAAAGAAVDKKGNEAAADKKGNKAAAAGIAGLSENHVLLSDSYFDKYGTEPGSELVLKEEFTSDKYSVVACGTYDYPASLAVFMTIDQFREMFDLKDNYYSGYFCNEELTDIPQSKVAAVITEEDLLTTSNQLEDSMGGAFRLFLGFSIILFILMVYLLAKLVTERNAYSISMLKILGYTNREAGRLYNRATGIVVLISLILSGVLGLQLIRVIYYTMMQSFSGWLTFYAAPWGVPVLIATGIACYGLVNLILMRRIRHIPMTDALKDAE